MTTLDLPCSYLWLTCGILIESIERSIYKIFSIINNATYNRIMKNNLKHRCNYMYEIKFHFQVLKSWIFNRIPCEKRIHEYLFTIVLFVFVIHRKKLRIIPLEKSYETWCDVNNAKFAFYRRKKIVYIGCNK